MRVRTGLATRWGTAQLLREVSFVNEAGELDALIAANPDLVRCDAFIINDGGNMKKGEPELTAALEARRAVERRVVDGDGTVCAEWDFGVSGTTDDQATTLDATTHEPTVASRLRSPHPVSGTYV